MLDLLVGCAAPPFEDLVEVERIGIVVAPRKSARFDPFRGQQAALGHDDLTDSIPHFARHHEPLCDVSQSIAHRPSAIRARRGGRDQELRQQGRHENRVARTAIPSHETVRSLERAKGAMGPLSIRREPMVELGEDFGQDSHLPREPNGAVRRAASKETQYLLEKSGGSCSLEESPVSKHRGVELWCDPNFQPRGELDGPKYPNGILLETNVGISYGAHEPPFDIVQTADEIDDLPLADIVEESVDREVPPAGVFMGLAEDVVALEQEGTSFARWRGLTSKRRHLDDFSISKHHVGQTKTSADDAAVSKKPTKLWRPSARGDIEILRLVAEQ